MTRYPRVDGQRSENSLAEGWGFCFGVEWVGKAMPLCFELSEFEYIAVRIGPCDFM